MKALNDLTNVLKQKRNNKGIVKYEALQRIDKILNNIPATEQQVPPMKSKRVIFDKVAKPPREILLLDSFSAKLPNHGNRDSHVNTFPLF